MAFHSKDNGHRGFVLFHFVQIIFQIHKNYYLQDTLSCILSCILKIIISSYKYKTPCPVKCLAKLISFIYPILTGQNISEDVLQDYYSSFNLFLRDRMSRTYHVPYLLKDHFNEFI